MTTNDPLMEQCRKEAYQFRVDNADELRENGYDLDSWTEAYAAALYHERSKPKWLSDEEIERKTSEWQVTATATWGTGPVSHPVPAIYKKACAEILRQLRDHYAPPGTLTVDQAVEVVLKWQDESAFQCDPYLDKQALREALTAAAR
jgi:ketosteroid isomerase-like protein